MGTLRGRGHGHTGGGAMSTWGGVMSTQGVGVNNDTYTFVVGSMQQL